MMNPVETGPAWVLCEEFAALHLRFAARVSVVVSLAMTDALERWTPARRQAGEAWAEVGPVPDAHRLWRAYHSGSTSRERRRSSGLSSGRPVWGSCWPRSRCRG